MGASLRTMPAEAVRLFVHPDGSTRVHPPLWNQLHPAGLHPRDTRGAGAPKEDPIMFQLNEPSGDTTLANDMRAAYVTRRSDQSTLLNSPMSQEVLL